MRAVLFMVVTGWVASGAAGMIACVQPVGVHTASLKTAPFGSYRTFSLADPEGPPEGYKMSPRSAQVQRRLRPLIEAELQAKGYSLATGKGDFVVAYGSGRREVSIRHPQRAPWSDEDENEDFVEGSVVIDVFDGSNDGQVWHGATRAQIDPDKIDQAQLERTVRLLLATYPAARVSAIRSDERGPVTSAEGGTAATPDMR